MKYNPIASVCKGVNYSFELQLPTKTVEGKTLYFDLLRCTAGNLWCMMLSAKRP